MLKAGDQAPLFSAGGTGGDLELAALLKEGPVVLYFFPRAFTPGWTVEAVEFNHALPDFQGLGIQVVGSSVDPLQTLQRFRDKHDLRFPLVTDSQRAIGEAYGTLKDGPGARHERDTVLIGTDGNILLAYQRVHAKGHAAEVLAAARRLREEGLV